MRLIDDDHPSVCKRCPRPRMAGSRFCSDFCCSEVQSTAGACTTCDGPNDTSTWFCTKCSAEHAAQAHVAATFYAECERCHRELMVVASGLAHTIAYVTDPGFRIVRVTRSWIGASQEGDVFYYCDCAPACETCMRATPHLEASDNNCYCCSDKPETFK